MDLRSLPRDILSLVDPLQKKVLVPPGASWNITLRVHEVLSGIYIGNGQKVCMEESVDDLMARIQSGNRPHDFCFIEKKEQTIQGDKRDILAKISKDDLMARIQSGNRPHDFCFIEKKEQTIQGDKRDILAKISKNGKLSNEDKEKLTWLQTQGRLTQNEVLISMKGYLIGCFQSVYSRVNSPLFIRYGSYTERVQGYHDLDHDLLSIEQQILAWAIQHRIVSDGEHSRLEEILRQSGNTMDYFLREHYTGDLLEKYMQSLES